MLPSLLSCVLIDHAPHATASHTSCACTHLRKEPGSVRFVSVPFSKIHRFGSVRFGSVRFGSVRFGSENYISRSDAVRPAFFGRVVDWSGSVPRPVPAGPGIHRFGAVRPVRFGFLFLPSLLGFTPKGRVPSETLICPYTFPIR